MLTDARQGALLNIVVGIAGALIGGWLFGILTGNAVTINNGVFNLTALAISFVGAVVLLGIVNLITRGTVR
jgi:uncharacterized membrane protein YeaQ/YmgE (transglycosylase-associated protein family)